MARVSVSKEMWSKLLKRVARKTRGSNEAEDLLHSAYLRLERYKDLGEVADPSAFLVRAAYNISIDNFRHNRLLTEGVDPETKDGAPLQDEVIAARVRLERMKEGLAQLSPLAREVLLLRRLEGLKYHEISERLNVSRSTVERTVAKATTFLVQWTNGW